MRTFRRGTASLVLVVLTTMLSSGQSTAPQQPKSEPPAFDRPVTYNRAPATPTADRISTVTGDDVKLGVDLVVLDALVVEQKTGRVTGGLAKTDFALYEDGVKQEISHFSQDTLPLSVLIMIDRGGCLDPFSEKVRSATMEALNRLRPQDEVALMSFADTTELLVRFGRDKDRVIEGLNRVPPHDEAAEHCFNRAFYDAAEYMRKAGNPNGRRVIIVITGITTALDCSGPSGEDTRMALFESGSVVCAIIPKTPVQRAESGAMRSVTGIAGMFKVHNTNLNQLAEQTGGEIMSDKPENLNRTFHDLIDHLRTRYSVGFVSTNKAHDGKFRKLRLDLTSQPQTKDGRLVVKTRRGYISPSEKIDDVRTSSSK